jgi:hypothetical protein
MLKKEVSEVLKHSIIFILVVLLLPAILILSTIISDQSYFSVFFPLFQFGLFFWALFMGISLFSGDRSQKGMEYLLSLPYSRLQLIGIKILPRLCAVILFYLVFVLLYKTGGFDAAATTFIPFTAIYFTIFLLALSLSAFSDNFIILSVTSLFSLFVYYGLLYVVYWAVLKVRGTPLGEFDFKELLLLEPGLFLWLDIPKFLPIVALALLVPFLLSFALSIQKFDMRPARVLNKRFFKYFTPIFVCCLAISFLFAYQGTKHEYQDYYLTHDKKLIESNYYSKIKIYDGDNVYKTEKKFEYFWPNIDEDEYAYDLWGEQVVRLNTSNHKVEILYDPLEKRKLTWIRCKYDNTIVSLQKNAELSGAELVLLDLSSKKITRIPVSYPLIDYPLPRIFGTDKMGDKRFWLICSVHYSEYPILRVWEDGKTDIIGKSQKRPSYINQILITYTDDAIVISKDFEGQFKTIREIPWELDFPFSTGPNFYLDTIPLKEIYAHRHRNIVRLNLETLEVEEIGEFTGYLRYFHPGNYYFVETIKPGVSRNIYKLKEGRMELIKSFPDFDIRKKHSLRVFKAGVVFIKDKEINVYAFPDMKEIKFKKL